MYLSLSPSSILQFNHCQFHHFHHQSTINSNSTHQNTKTYQNQNQNPHNWQLDTTRPQRTTRTRPPDLCLQLVMYMYMTTRRVPIRVDLAQRVRTRAHTTYTHHNHLYHQL